MLTLLCLSLPTIVSNVSVQIWGADSKTKNDPKVVIYFGSPNQIRTGVLALKGRCPGPLDDGAKTASFRTQNAAEL